MSGMWDGPQSLMNSACAAGNQSSLSASGYREEGENQSQLRATGSGMRQITTVAGRPMSRGKEKVVTQCLGLDINRYH